jgi:hypothetical protein
VLVIGGMLTCCAHPVVGIPIAALGFAVFLTGRFM